MKNLKHSLFAVLMLLASGTIHSEDPPAASSDQDKAVARDLFENVKKAKTARYRLSQTQSHLSVPEVQRLVTTKTAGLAKNKKIIDAVMNREQDHKKDYYTLYTAIPFMHLFQDVAFEMHKRSIGTSPAINKNAFQFVRYNYKDSNYDRFKTASEFLEAEIKKNGTINDREGGLGLILVSTNLSLVGNAGFTGESTWHFYNNPQPWAEVNRNFLVWSLESYGYSTDFVDELLGLLDYLKDDKGNLGMDLYQIFVPRNKIDDVGYVAWRMGIPFDQEVIPKIIGWNKEKPMTFGIKDGLSFPVLEKSVQDFIKQYNANDPAAKAVAQIALQNLQRGDYRLSKYLDQYVGNPQKTPAINYTQGRLLITNDVLLNPDSGVLVYRYYTLNPQKERTYKQKLQEIINRMEIDRRTRLATPTTPEPSKGSSGKVQQIQDLIEQENSRQGGALSNILRRIQRILQEGAAPAA